MGKGRHLTDSERQMRTLQQMLGITNAEDLQDEMKDAVFVCIDVEAYEHAQEKITEIGVAVLDTRDLVGLTLDSPRDAWLSKFKHAHYRMVDYAELRNKSFVQGCPDSFNFGVTTWINLRDVSEVLTRMFQDPTRVDDAANFASAIPAVDRHIVFVAHGAKGDRAYLNSIGFELDQIAVIVRTMDTQVLSGRSKKNQVALRRLLLSLELTAVNLHNAGNDAAYTLHAMVLMALKDHASPGSVYADLELLTGKIPLALLDSRKAPEKWEGTAGKALPASEGDAQTKLRVQKYALSKKATEKRTNLEANIRYHSAVTKVDVERNLAMAAQGTGPAAYIQYHMAPQRTDQHSAKPGENGRRKRKQSFRAADKEASSKRAQAGLETGEVDQARRQERDRQAAGGQGDAVLGAPKPGEASAGAKVDK